MPPSQRACGLPQRIVTSHAEEDTNEQLLRLVNVSKTYDSQGLRRSAPTLAVDSVSFVIRRGETFGLVGESGSGKSTTARLIIGLDRVSDGRIYFMGRDVTSMSQSELRPMRKNMQIVFQDPIASLNRRKTVGEIIEFPLKVHGSEKPAFRRLQVQAALDLVGLPKAMADRYPHELSGGQGQRVGIARAIVLNPQLVVLDEAVSSLDVSVRAQVLNLLKELQQRLGLTYLFISHDLAVVRYMSDHVGVMFRGRIVEAGPRISLFSQPLHPYTEELLAADTSQQGAPPIITAGDQAPLALPDVGGGCRYRTRCYLGSNADICRLSDPELVSVRSDHSVACHLRNGAGADTGRLDFTVRRSIN
jgi:oligopeptide transport system ATP-binding protein